MWYWCHVEEHCKNVIFWVILSREKRSLLAIFNVSKNKNTMFCAILCVELRCFFWNEHSKNVTFRVILSLDFIKLYPSGSKREALRLGVHSILLYFITISLFTPKDFSFIWMVDGGWWVVSDFFWSSIFFKILLYIL